NDDGTVTDTLTGLIWMKNVGCLSGSQGKTWSEALSSVAALNAGTVACAGYTGRHTDWRLPHVRELNSLIDLSQSSGLPLGHPFSENGITAWSSTTRNNSSTAAWNISGRSKSYSDKGARLKVFPVRGG
ncbi:MAG: DUF1566 domain-containing protein, partial [Magnetococcus sp. WYHC-3]